MCAHVETSTCLEARLAHFPLCLCSDNVGDVAGMGADLFESFVGSLIAAATIGNAEYTDNRAVAFPFYIAGFGAIASILGTFLVRAKKREHKQVRPFVVSSGWS